MLITFEDVMLQLTLKLHHLSHRHITKKKCEQKMYTSYWAVYKICTCIKYSDAVGLCRIMLWGPYRFVPGVCFSSTPISIGVICYNFMGWVRCLLSGRDYFEWTACYETDKIFIDMLWSKFWIRFELLMYVTWYNPS